MESVYQKIKEEMKEFDLKVTSARIISREVIYKIIIICSSIIGFSLTLLSIPEIGLNVKVNFIRASWFLLLSTILVGFLSVFIEGRLELVITWRANQVQSPHCKKGYGLFSRILVLSVAFISIFVPNNLIFCRIYKNEDKKEYYEFLNFRIVHLLARNRRWIFILENLFIILFCVSLLLFILSYKV